MPKGDKNRKLTDEQRREIARLYTTPNPDGTWNGVKTIARLFGVMPNTIDQNLKRDGVAKRTIKEAYVNGKRSKPITNIPEGDAPLCKCGCNRPTAWNQPKNHWNKYVEGHYRPKTFFHSYEWLHEQYIANHRSSSDIAKEWGVNQTYVIHRLKQLGIPVRKQRETLILTGGVKGAKNASWKGGVTPERQRLYKTPEWKETVKAAFKRDNYLCQRCGAPKTKGRKLHAHHIQSFASNTDLRLEVSNLITLCDECHVWVHSLANVNHDYLG